MKIRPSRSTHTPWGEASRRFVKVWVRVLISRAQTLPAGWAERTDRGSTRRTTLAESPPKVAVIVADPCATPRTMPAVTVATVGVSLLQTAPVVTSPPVPSL